MKQWLSGKVKTAFDAAQRHDTLGALEVRASGVSPQVAAMLLQSCGWVKTSGAWKPVRKVPMQDAIALAQGLLLSTPHGRNFLGELIHHA